MANEATLHLDSDLRFTATTGSGFSVQLDSYLGDDSTAAASPMEMVLVALGGCTAMDVISVLRKMRQDIASYDLKLSGERAEGHPRTYTSILMTHRIGGTGVGESNARRAIELSMTKYCPVFAMLSPGVAIREVYEIRDTASGDVISGEVVLQP